MRPGYKGLTKWIARQAFLEHPDALRTRIRLEQSVSHYPWGDPHRARAPGHPARAGPPARRHPRRRPVRDRLSRCWLRWVRLWDGVEHPRSIALVRILLGLRDPVGLRRGRPPRSRDRPVRRSGGRGAVGRGHARRRPVVRGPVRHVRRRRPGAPRGDHVRGGVVRPRAVHPHERPRAAGRVGPVRRGAPGRRPRDRHPVPRRARRLRVRRERPMPVDRRGPPHRELLGGQWPRRRVAAPRSSSCSSSRCTSSRASRRPGSTGTRWATSRRCTSSSRIPRSRSTTSAGSRTRRGSSSPRSDPRSPSCSRTATRSCS